MHNSRIPRAIRRKHKPADSLEKHSSSKSNQITMLHVTAYDATNVVDEICDVSQLASFRDSQRVLWVDVQGLSQPELIDEIGSIFKIHPLAVEDILSAHQRAKIETYGDQFFLVTHMISENGSINTQQLSLVFGSNYVLSFHDEPMLGLNATRERIRSKQGLIRTFGADYLMYALVDSVIDSYFPVLERLGERLETLEDLVIENPTRESIGQIHIIKRELLILRRAIWPMRETINTLLRDGANFLSEEARLHLRDSYDHAVRILDFTETYREIGADLMDVYLSSVSNRLNEVMKMLTIITTIFAPPTFIAAIYGMNFDPNVSPYNMPEIRWYYGYPTVLIAMFISTLAILYFLWSKGWLGYFL